jgi:arsenate reductase-like glutaredoxin family protein
LSFFQGNVIKYVIRYKDKNGIEDLKKIIHYCELEIEEMKKENNQLYQKLSERSCKFKYYYGGFK